MAGEDRTFAISRSRDAAFEGGRRDRMAPLEVASPAGFGTEPA